MATSCSIHRKGLLGLLLLSILALTGCPKQPGSPTLPLDTEQAAQNWGRFLFHSAQAQAATSPFNAVLSLRYTEVRDSYRIGAYMWGNNETTSSSPLRLDLQTSIGSTVVKIREDRAEFLLYDVKAEKAYLALKPTREDGRGTSRRLSIDHFGVPIPFSLGELVLLISGRYAELFTPGLTSPHSPPELVASTENGGSVFRLPPGGPRGVLEIDRAGEPVLWREHGDQGWVMYLEMQPEGAFSAPRRLVINHPQGYEAVLTVRELNRQKTPFTPSQLDLILPPGTQLTPYGQ